MIPELVYLLFFAGLAGIVQGTVGFGFGLVAMSTLPLWMDIKEAVPVVALLCLVVNATLTWRLRKHLSWNRIGPLLIGSLAGVPAGVFLFATLDPNWLLVGLGFALLFVAVQQTWFAPQGKDTEVRPVWGGVAGLVSGVLGGAFNTGGPPVVMYVGVQSWSKEDTVATLQGFFLSTCVLQISLFVARGTVGMQQVQSAGTLLVAALIGVAIGQFLFHRVNQERFRALLLLGIGILGCSLVYKGLNASLG